MGTLFQQHRLAEEAFRAGGHANMISSGATVAALVVPAVPLCAMVTNGFGAEVDDAHQLTAGVVYFELDITAVSQAEGQC